MRWKKFTVNTTTEAEDLISMILMDLGVEGVQIENNVPLSESDTKGMFIDFLPDTKEDDGKSKLSFFLHLPDKDADTAPSVNNGSYPGSNDGKNYAVADNSYTISDRIWTEEEIQKLLDDISENVSEISAYINVGDFSITRGETNDTDWRDSWKQFFHPIETDSILIVPSWEEIPSEYEKRIRNNELCVIRIDPGTAFGTGSHETTRLCINALCRELKKIKESRTPAAEDSSASVTDADCFADAAIRVLDIGTGSGILGIAALISGADFVSATEIDEACASSIKDNLSLNGIDDETEFVLSVGNIINDENIRDKVHEGGKYDIITANILAPVIETLSMPGQADAFAGPGTVFIASGIIDTKEEEVLKAFSENPVWKVEEVMHLGEWVALKAVYTGKGD